LLGWFFLAFRRSFHVTNALALDHLQGLRLKERTVAHGTQGRLRAVQHTPGAA
jgi:hypothetical protein